MARLHPVARALAVVSATLVVVALIAALALTSTVRRSFPDRDGDLDVAGLTGSVSVLRDDQGVPQVYADSAHDLFLAQGYVQAQDRFFEMDLRRHVTAGRLSELVGQGRAALASDRVVRTLGWRRVAERELPLLSASTRTALQDFSDGVNAYLDGRSPAQLGVEYTLLDARLPAYRPEPWTPVDSLAWLKAMAWDLKANYDDELTRARLSAALPERRIEQLYPSYPFDRNLPVLDAGAGSAPATAPAAPPATVHAARTAGGTRALASAQRALAAVPALLGRGAGVGSNAWVVSGAHTASGKPMLANDPHLKVGVPGVWYQMGLHCRTVSSGCPYDVAGFTFAGLPGVVVGHNARIAWGLTNLGADVTDLFLERVVGDSVQYDGEFDPLARRREVIKVRGGSDVTITVRSTRHGPLLSDVLASVADGGRLTGQARKDDAGDAPDDDHTYDVALSWTALTPGRTADALLAIDRAQSWDQFRAASRTFDVPSQNLVYADVDGSIGYQTPGRIPVRQGFDGRWPVPGWTSRYAWTSAVPFDRLPHALNPPSGMLVTANQPVQQADAPYLTRDWAYGYRAQRIRTLLLAHPRLTVADDAAIQADTSNPMAPVLVPLLLSTDLGDDAFTRTGQQLLRGWDYRQPADSAAAAYFNAVWRNLLRLGFDDELGAGDLAADGGDRWYEVVTQQLRRRADPWWDNRATPGAVENRDEIIRQAMVEARVELTRTLGKDAAHWQWGRLHRLELRHPVLGADSVPGPVRALADRGPYDLGGGSSAVDATDWSAGDGYGVTTAPSMRMVVDLADLDHSTWVVQTGVSGHPYDAHYTDQTDHWASGRSYPWPSSERAVRRAATDEQTMRPARDG